MSEDNEIKDLEDRVELATRWLNEDEVRFLEENSRDPKLREKYALMKNRTKIKPYEAMRCLLADLMSAVHKFHELALNKRDKNNG